jgi:hypothetical protein
VTEPAALLPPVTHIPQGSVVITPTEVFHEMRAIHDEVKEMRVELRDISDHESRLRALERRIWLASGAATTIGAGLGALAAKLLGGI